MACLSGNRLGITLLTVAPGTEDSVIKSLLGTVNDENANVFLTLGRSDIALIRQANIEEEPEPELRTGALPNISCAKEFDCYLWHGRYEVRDVMKQKLCAMIFLRFNPDIAGEPGCLEVELERRLADYLCVYDSGYDDVKWLLLGSYGRASNIILIGASDITALLKTTEEIIVKSTTFTDDGPRAVLRETYTIIGAEWPKTESGIKSLKNKYGMKNLDEAYFEDAEVSLELRCCSADVIALSKKAFGIWTDNISPEIKNGVANAPKVTIAYGPSDVNVRFPLLEYDSFGTLIVDIHEFRNDCWPALLTSESQIELLQKEKDKVEDYADPFLSERDVKPWNVKITPEQAKEILDSHKGAAGVLHSFYAYNHRLADDGGEAVKDMFLYYKECSKLAQIIAHNRLKEDPIAEDLRWLYKMLEEGQIGQIQRLDAFPMSRRTGTDLGPYRSGIRRRLWAAQAIPWYIFSKLLQNDDGCQNEWRGFLIGGRLRDEFVTRPPVMMIPPESLPHPEQWWVLSHESMHDYVERNTQLMPEKDLNKKNDDDNPWPEIQRALSEQFPRAKEQRYFEYLAAECLSDMLEYLSLGAMDWKDHQRICWADILDRLAADPGREKVERYDIVAEHVLRTACAIWCVPECRDMSTAALLDKFVQEVISILQEEGKRVSGFYEARSVGALYARLIQMCEVFKPATEWLLKQNPFQEKVQKQRREWAESQYELCRDQLKDGELVKPGQLQYPDLLVWFLRRDWLSKPMPPQMASATTLSLLWYYLENKQI